MTPALIVSAPGEIVISGPSSGPNCTLSILHHLLSVTARRFVINNAFITDNFQPCIISLSDIKLVSSHRSWRSKCCGRRDNSFANRFFIPLTQLRINEAAGHPARRSTHTSAEISPAVRHVISLSLLGSSLLHLSPAFALKFAVQGMFIGRICSNTLNYNFWEANHELQELLAWHSSYLLKTVAGSAVFKRPPLVED